MVYKLPLRTATNAPNCFNTDDCAVDKDEKDNKDEGTKTENTADEPEGTA